MNGIESAIRALLKRVETLGTVEGLNLVAFSGGIDSSLVAYAVHTVFPDSSIACLGVSASLPAEQARLASDIASHIGIPLRRVETAEGTRAEYIANTGMSCYHCKTALYDTMERLIATAESEGAPFVMYNGTNADDLADHTRVGLRAASEHHVASPLADLTKADIRELSRHAGLPNWNIAASPCLRSRLQIGVAATTDNLSRIENAERALRQRFAIPATVNFRVRHMTDNNAVIEIDDAFLAHIDLASADACLRPLGFADVRLRAFHSGSVSRAAGQSLPIPAR